MIRLFLSMVGIAVVAVVPMASGEKGTSKVAPALDFKVKNIDGKEVHLGRYQDKVVLIVNVASECGYTPQYKSLQALHAKYAKDGLAILGFPCNDFGAQEPGDEKQIKKFCATNYGVDFDMFAKVGIQGNTASPLYQMLQSKQRNPQHGGAVKWNFEKFLLSRSGQVVGRFASDADLDGKEFMSAVLAELKKKSP